MKCFFTRSEQLIAIMAVLVLCAFSAWAQGSDQSAGAAPAATGAAERNTDNPPLTGLDRPVLEPLFGGRSYLVPGLQLSQSVDGYTSGGGNAFEVTRALGSLDLMKTWKRSQFGLDYIAGGTFYEGSNLGSVNAYQMHTMSADERILWRTGQFAIRDSFDYLPEGAFGFDSFGGAGGFDASGGLSGVGPGGGVGSGLTGAGTPAFGGGGYGSFGIQPRIDNSSIVDISQAFSARSSVTLAAGYSIGHYLDKSNSAFQLFDSQQTTAQIGYNRLLNARDQIAISYVYQQFHYPQQAGIGSGKVQVWNVLYGHRISGRLNFVVGGGPQLVTIHTPATQLQILPGLFITFPATTMTSLSGAGNVTLDYTVSSRTALDLSYRRYVSAGSGYFAGAKTDAVRAGVSHLFARHWTTSTDLGFARNANLQTGSPGGGSLARAYDYWYAGTSIRRQIGKHFDAFVAYQYDRFGFSSCPTTGAACGAQSHHHNGVVGIEWHPNPLHLD